MAQFNPTNYHPRDAREITSAVQAEAERRGYIYPDMMINIIDADLISVEEDGEVVGVTTAVALIQAERPLHFGRHRPRSGGTPPARLPHSGGPTWPAAVPWQVAATSPRHAPVDPATREAMARSGRYTRM